ncbi:unnamed protein product [Mesocestoides corti]|uniref:DUF5739 domain-containing protein n=1 Tax=Mesocestoides corti TaxID=53468 RepID=A0A158QTE8_MESCO|nr:unnamed protein product [Mesocestoides corti]
MDTLIHTGSNGWATPIYGFLEEPSGTNWKCGIVDRSRWSLGPTPKDLLTSEEVAAHERAIQKADESQQSLRRTQRILRLQHLQWLSHREFMASFGKLSKRSVIAVTDEPITVGTSTTEGSQEITLSTNEKSNSTDGILPVSEGTDSTTIPPPSTDGGQFQELSAVATVHRLAIRSNTISISGGVLRARLRYLIQLHRAIEGQHSLSVEVRLHPQYPPIYTGTVDDVCTYWPADAPGSRCSLKRKRFYQNGSICLCHMPPGIYHQRLKINFGNVFEGAQISEFLINLLFSGQNLNLYVTVRILTANNAAVACLQSKIPVSFSSV